MKTSSIANRPTLLETGKYRFLIMDAPTDANVSAYITVLQKYNVSVVVRACEPTYSSQPLLDAGISVAELSFADGEPPPDSVITMWLDLVQTEFGALQALGAVKPDQLQQQQQQQESTVAVHCVAGLGRAPVLVAIALVEGGMDPYDAIEFIRQKRRGAINAKQLKFIESYKPRRHSTHACSPCLIL